MNENLKRYLPYLVAILVFITITVLYCFPQFQGKVLQQSDILSWKSMSQELREFRESTGETSHWAGSMFSGMPSYQISGGTPTTNFINKVNEVLHLGFTSTMGYIIGYLLGFFILLRAFGVNRWLSIAGAVAIAFSSYFFIIIEAGHLTKAATIGHMAAVIGGFHLIFNRKYLWGVPITLIYTIVGSLQHPQMTYYVFMCIGVLAIAELVAHIQRKEVAQYAKSVVIFTLAVLLSLGARYGLYSVNSEYVKETMRGGHSELVQAEDSQADDVSSGLDLAYATQWSYGRLESFTFMIPNFMGASSHYNVGEDSDIYKEMLSQRVPRNQARSFVQSLPMYWGTQPFTSGPVYMGAIVCFLFVLSLFLVKGPYLWGLLAATVFSILLSWGSNFMWFTELFFEYFPMYNKFRAVSSILIVAEITMPLLGLLGLKAIMDKQVTKSQVLNAVKYATAITAGICAVFALFGGSLFSFSAPSDARMFAQLPQWLSAAIVDERATMLRSDAFRSLIFILLSAAVVWFYAQEKLRCKYFILAMSVLVAADMIPVSLRFFNHDSFVEQKQQKSYFAMQPYEKAILQDKDPHFRVFNFAANTFNDARTSYRLKSIGGYHAAKLRRYQDLIDAHLSKNNMNVINMLNTKYIIVPGQNGQPTPQFNPDAMGNAWFIDELKLVDTPNQESDALNHLDLRTTAVADKRFASQASLLSTNPDSTAVIRLTSYAPNKIEYSSTSEVDKVAVFSEIYYPYDWQAFIDDVPVPHFRANYTLRAMNITAGEHVIRFESVPTTLIRGEKIATTSFVISGLIILSCMIYPLYRRRKRKVTSL